MEENVWIQLFVPGCNLRIEPIRVFEKSKGGKQWWRITRCPRERCGFNLDIERYERPGNNEIRNGRRRTLFLAR